MCHPLSNELHEIRFGNRVEPGFYAGWPQWEERAAQALDAYHEAFDGLEVEPCYVCDGTGNEGGKDFEGCHFCLGTGKRLRKRESP